MLALSSLLLTLLFPPLYCFFLAPIALVPLVACILRRPLRPRHFAMYYLAGIWFFLASAYWLISLSPSRIPRAGPLRRPLLPPFRPGSPPPRGPAPPARHHRRPPRLDRSRIHPRLLRPRRLPLVSPGHSPRPLHPRHSSRRPLRRLGPHLPHRHAQRLHCRPPPPPARQRANKFSPVIIRLFTCASGTLAFISPTESSASTRTPPASARASPSSRPTSDNRVKDDPTTPAKSSTPTSNSPSKPPRRPQARPHRLARNHDPRRINNWPHHRPPVPPSPALARPGTISDSPKRRPLHPQPPPNLCDTYEVSQLIGYGSSTPAPTSATPSNKTAPAS